MRYGSVCSGIEAASVAWSPLGWKPQFFAEIEAFPSAVLKHHYPDVPNHGDMTKFKDWPDHAIELLVGGTPCQSFSVAGLRAGLADPRGNLALTYLAIAAKYRPRWLVWENVPGVLSADGGEAFGSILGGMVELGYGVAYRVLDAQFCRTLGFAGAVPQRRRRVFVVGYLGDWRRAAAVLFDGAGLRGDSPPRRKAGQTVAPTISSRPTGGGGLGTDFDLDGGLTAVAHALRADGFDALKARDYKGVSSDGDGDGAPIIPEIASALTRGAESAGKGGYAGRRQEDDSNITAFNARMGGDPTMGLGVIEDGSSYTLDRQAPSTAIAFTQNSRSEVREINGDGAVVGALAADAGAQQQNYVATGWVVRRLTPVECCRLQGFPDDHLSQVTYRGKAPADGPIYKALGNSMAVNAMRVLGQRIQMVDDL